MKDVRLEINNLALNSCFSYRNVFQMSSPRVKNGFRKPGFWSKSSNFRVVWTIDFVQISLACSTNIFKGMYGKTLDFQCQH